MGVLGSDGGALCKDPASALRKSICSTSSPMGPRGPGGGLSLPTAGYSRDSYW